MAESGPSAALTRVRWFRRIVPIIIGLVGLFFLAIGGLQLVSQGWAHATGTVGDCTAHIVRTGSNRHTEQNCRVSWVLDGKSHTADIATGSGVHTGGTIDLRVNGGNVAVATPAWVGPAMGGLGLALVVVAVIMIVRSRRRTP